MCEMCHCAPCLPGCPNEPDMPTVYVCKCCGEPIVQDEFYYEFAGSRYHEECFEDTAVDILLEHGATKGTAELEESDYDD